MFYCQQARLNNIDETQIRRWRRDEAKIIETDEKPKRMRSTSIGEKFGHRSRVTGGGRKPIFDDIEKEVMKWIDERRSKGWVVSRDLIKKCALELYRDQNKDENETEENFTVSDGWITNFMRRNGLALREKTHQVRKWKNCE